MIEHVIGLILMTLALVFIVAEAIFLALAVAALIWIILRRAYAYVLMALILTSCASAPPRVVTLPPQCPAPREAPQTRTWPPTLPALVVGTQDPAQAVLLNRKDSEAQYEGLLVDFMGLVSFIRGENAVSSAHP